MKTAGHDRKAGRVVANAAAAALLAACPAAASEPPTESAAAMIEAAGRGRPFPDHVALHGDLGWQEGAWLLRARRDGLPVVEIPGGGSLTVVALLENDEVIEHMKKAGLRDVLRTPDGGLLTRFAWLDVRLADGRRGWVLATDENGIPLVTELPDRGRPAPMTEVAATVPASAPAIVRGGPVPARDDTSPGVSTHAWLVFAALVAGLAGGLKLARRRVWLTRDEDPLATKAERTLVPVPAIAVTPATARPPRWPRTAPVTGAPAPPLPAARPRPAPPRPTSPRVPPPPRSLEQALAAISDDLVRTTLVRLVRANFDSEAAESLVAALDRHFRTNFDATDRREALRQLHSVLVSLAGTEGADAYRKLEAICRIAQEPRSETSVEAPTSAAPPVPRAHGVR